MTKKSNNQEVSKNLVPKHVAIIMDGNGRWAEMHGKERIFGHQNGVKSVRLSVEAALESGVEYLTLFAFSTENWNRPAAEVNALMELFMKALINETDDLRKNNVSLRFIGNTDILSESIKEQMSIALEKTKNCTALKLIVALNYSGKWDVVEAARKLLQNPPQEPLTEEMFEKCLSTAEFPEPDLLIRTSNELRISNFLLYQLAYTELYFTPVLWPDFSKEEFFKAIRDFQSRQRRFGLTATQLTPSEENI